MIWEILSELPLENIICGDRVQGAAIVSLASRNLSQTGSLRSHQEEGSAVSRVYSRPPFPHCFPFLPQWLNPLLISPVLTPSHPVGLGSNISFSGSVPSLLPQMGLPPSLSPFISLISRLLFTYSLSLPPRSQLLQG